MKLFDFINSLESIQRRMTALEEEKRMLTKPIIEDYGRLGEIYNLFENELTRKTDVKPNSIEGRRIFIFIAIRLCYPAVFAKGNIRFGLRNKMANVLNCEASVISHDFKNLTFLYKKYKSFRNQVDKIYEGMLEQINDN